MMKFKRPIPEAALEAIPIFAMFGIVGLATYVVGKAVKHIRKKDTK
jgi:hypothetical protein